MRFFVIVCVAVEATLFKGVGGPPPDADLTLYRVLVSPRRANRDVDECAAGTNGEATNVLLYIPIIIVDNAGSRLQHARYYNVHIDKTPRQKKYDDVS